MNKHSNIKDMTGRDNIKGFQLGGNPKRKKPKIKVIQSKEKVEIVDFIKDVLEYEKKEDKPNIGQDIGHKS